MVDTSAGSGIVIVTVVLIVTLTVNVIAVVIIIALCRRSCRSRGPHSEAVYEVADGICSPGPGHVIAFQDANGYEIPIPPPVEYDIPLPTCGLQSLKNTERTWNVNVKKCTIEMNPENHEINFDETDGAVYENSGTEGSLLLKPRVKLTLTVQ